VDVLDEQERAFSRYKKQTRAAPEVRLRWLQGVGAGVGLLVHYLGTLEHALPPRLTPLVSAFERLLGQLIPGHAAVFVPERFFNYELREVHAQSFDQVLGPQVDRHKWPALFLKLPLGLLDSPRNHILVGHELGHAIAAVSRAELHRHARLAEEARRKAEGVSGETKGGDAPSSDGGGQKSAAVEHVPSELLPRPQIDPTRILQIVQQMCREGGISIPAPSASAQVAIEQVIFQGLIAKVASDVATISERWIEELFADAIGVCLFGPAFIKAFADVLLPTGRLAQASFDHPPQAVRVIFQHDLLAQKEFGDFAAAIPSELKERLDAIVALAKAALPAVPGSTTSPSERETYALSYDSVHTVRAEIMAIAMKQTAKMLYTATQYKDDLDRYLDTFRSIGVPPIGVIGETRVSLATILNVAQLVSMGAPVHVAATAEPAARERCLDDLILKAVELAEFQIGWEEA
jgi:hypothetical protein